MSEENQVEDIDPKDDVNTEVNAAEEKARAQGWVPKDEWTGDGKWRDAESFLDRGELFGKIDTQRREIKQLQQAQADFHKYLTTARQAEFKRAMDTLRTEKKAALIDGDPDAVIRADEKIIALNNEVANTVQDAKQPTVQEPHPEFVKWATRNSWYESSRPMRAFADELGNELAQKGLSPNEVLKEVESQVRKEFPNRFTNPNREKAGSVEGGSVSKAPAKNDSFPLSDDERRIMNSLVKSGVLTKEQYISDLKVVKERN